MENNKYYVPEISEFHVGFEYEHSGLLDINQIKEEFYPFIYNLEDKTLEEINYAINNNWIRVKYLDKEDIESLGWKLGVLRLFNKDLTLFQLDKYPNYVLTTPIEAYEKTHIIDISRVKSIGEGLDRVFNGFIKNLSELKKLMQQLNIK